MQKNSIALYCIQYIYCVVWICLLGPFSTITTIQKEQHMKPQLPWLLALFASSPALAHSEPSPMLNPTPASPLQLEQQLLQQHSERHLQQKEHRQPPKQIRSVSPRQVEQLQSNQLNKSVATPQLREATDLQMQTQSNQNVVVQNTGCTTAADLTGLSGAALVEAE